MGGSEVADPDSNSGALSVRDRLLAEASRLFAANGYHQTSTREIAAASDVELSTLFHHFASKAEMINAMLKHDLGAAVAAAEGQLKRSGSPAGRLYCYLIEDIGLASRSPYAVGVNATSGLLRELDFAGARARSQRLTDARVAMIREGIEAGEFVEVDPDSASRAIEWTIEGSLAEMAGGRTEDPDLLARQIADLCLRSLVVDAAALARVQRDFPAPADQDRSS